MKRDCSDESIVLPDLTPEFFRVYVDRLEGSSFDLAQAVNFETEAMEPSNVDSQVFERLHRLCTWWREAEFLEDSELKNAIMDILVGQDIDNRSDVLSKLAPLIAGEEMEESGLRLWWVEYMVTTLNEDNIEALCRELPKDILVDLLKAQVKLSKEGKVENFRDRVRGGERYYEQDQGEILSDCRGIAEPHISLLHPFFAIVNAWHTKTPSEFAHKRQHTIMSSEGTVAKRKEKRKEKRKADAPTSPKKRPRMSFAETLEIIVTDDDNEPLRTFVVHTDLVEDIGGVGGLFKYDGPVWLMLNPDAVEVYLNWVYDKSIDIVQYAFVQPSVVDLGRHFDELPEQRESARLWVGRIAGLFDLWHVGMELDDYDFGDKIIGMFLHSSEPLTLVFGTNSLEKKYIPVHPDLVCAHSQLFRVLHDKADVNGRIEGLPISAYAKTIMYLDYLTHPGRNLERHVKRQVREEMDISDPEDTGEKQFCEVVRRLSEMWLLGRGFEDAELQNSAMSGLLKQDVGRYPVEMHMLAREIVDCEELRWTELHGWFVHAIGATVEERDLRVAGGPVSRWSRELLMDVLSEMVEYQAKSQRRAPGMSDRSAYMVGQRVSEESEQEREDSALEE
ncbi:uncharacterized protein MYCFIDRAFT_83659 [Pseudocercospora fijiensis CIRAD86]|uniref:Uncharacterized protein n=1 Tax=Pseudocercospora fijiensis (strain CIRAD86) TaxID=383855 RepID=M3BB35_PSEFD|nr:uncharacterized protein MYCFIDRAFT_83659 [Pseudocercospora fijiensis CIRAD86]EME86522.1 hypothetical protein MYCFIDRAFT_83659 [Pseudocercospora fijiensis CIRAD86]